MAEPGTQAVTWAARMEHLRDSAQQRVLGAPMPIPAMDQLLADGKATALGHFEGSPVHYMNHWWRLTDTGWVALDEEATAELNRHAERYQAATAAVGAPQRPAAASPETASTPAPSQAGTVEA